MKHSVTIKIDTDHLKSITDEYLAGLYTVAQINPAVYGDFDAGELATRINDEIVRRWLKSAPIEMYNHSSEQAYHRELTRHCIFVGGQWVPRTDKESTDVQD